MPDPTLKKAGTPVNSSFPTADYRAASTYFNVCIRTLKDWVKYRKIPHYRINGRIRFDLEMAGEHLKKKGLVQPK